MRPIGIMQGRLVPRYQQRYQAHPVGYWEGEFHIAAAMGFGHIEFILDFNDAAENPLMTPHGLDRIKGVTAHTGVAVNSICADYFMEAPLFSDQGEESLRVLRLLIEHAGRLGVRDIVIPCVDQSTLATESQKSRLAAALNEVGDLALSQQILLNLETDLAPAPFRALLDLIAHPSIRVNYDIGNSASLGYDPVEEFEAYGTLLSDLHIKDRALGGASVPLGTGDAQLPRVFDLLKKIGFEGNIVMQAARAMDYLEDLHLVRQQKELVVDFLNVLES